MQVKAGVILVNVDNFREITARWFAKENGFYTCSITETINITRNCGDLDELDPCSITLQIKKIQIQVFKRPLNFNDELDFIENPNICPNADDLAIQTGIS